MNVGDEVLVTRAYGHVFQPHRLGRIVAKNAHPATILKYLVVFDGDDDHVSWLECSEGWLIEAHPVIEEFPTLIDL